MVLLIAVVLAIKFVAEAIFVDVRESIVVAWPHYNPPNSLSLMLSIRKCWVLIMRSEILRPMRRLEDHRCR
jgi:hypothetical protein